MTPAQIAALDALTAPAKDARIAELEAQLAAAKARADGEFEGWFCEKHPDQPMNHDGCGWAGMLGDDSRAALRSEVDAAVARADAARDAALVEAARLADGYGPVACDTDTRDAILALRDKPVPEMMVREAIRSVIDGLSSTYTARNGRKISIEGDDGEKCWIICNDGYEALRAIAGGGNE